MDARAAGGACCSSRAASTRPRGSTATRSRCCPNYARAEAGLGAVAVARGNLAEAERWYDRAASHLPLPEIVAQLGDVRAARGDRAGAREAYALVRLEQEPVRPLRRQRRPRDGALRGVPSGHALAGRRRRAGAQGARRTARRSTVTTRSPGRCTRRATAAGSARGDARKPPRHDRPAALVAPRSDRRLRGQPAVARAALEQALARHAALPPARRPGGAAAAGEARMTARMREAKWHSPRVPLGTCRARRRAVPLAVLVPAAAAHPLGNFTVNQYTRLDVAQAGVSVRYVLDMAEIPTFQRRRSVDANGDGQIGAGERARERDRLVAARAAASAAARRTASRCGSRSRARAWRSRAGRAGSRRRGSTPRFRAVGLALGGCAAAR